MVRATFRKGLTMMMQSEMEVTELLLHQTENKLTNYPVAFLSRQMPEWTS